MYLCPSQRRVSRDTYSVSSHLPTPSDDVVTEKVRFAAVMVVVAMACAPAAAPMPPSEFGPATWALDPAFPPPRTDARELQIVVWERACSSGTPTTGRVSEPVITTGTTSVSITIGVRPLAGDQTCPLPRGTPIVVTLPEPLGSRTLIDGGRVPPAPPRPPS